MLSIYLAELEGITPLEAGEEEALLEQLKNGVVFARDRLVEGNLHLVLECVTDYEDYGSSLSDLIQEGNVALLSAIDEAAVQPGVMDGTAFMRQIEQRVHSAIEALPKEEEVADAAAIRFAREANRLFDVTKEFEEREGRAAAMEELVRETGLTAEIMNLPVRLREAALLCWLQGLTYNEAADALGISFQAVSSRLNRARKRLRFAMEGSEEHESA